MKLRDTVHARTYRLFDLLSAYTEKQQGLHLMNHKQLGVPWMGISH